MRRIETPDGLFHDGNPATGELGTILSASWLNAIQQEIIEILGAAGLVPDGERTDQLLAAIRNHIATGALALRSGLITTQDWNSLTTQGLYNVASEARGQNFPAPTAYSYGVLLVAEAGDGSGVSQLYMAHATSELWYRGGWNNGDWGPWRRVDAPDFSSIRNTPTTLGGYGIADAAPAASALMARAVIGHAAIDSVVDNGFRRVSYDGFSRSLLSFNTESSVGPLQIEADYGGQLRWRNKRDNAAWSAWYDIWHSGNANASLAQNGYQRLPGGLILQWGFGNLQKGSSYNFPVAFPQAVFHWSPCHQGSDGTATPTLLALEKHAFVPTWNNVAQEAAIYWFALGH